MAQLKKILLVDDDDDLREALGEQLIMTEDFDVFEADDGASAMVKAKEGIYDLVILDVGLPDTDGRELCRLMRKHLSRSNSLFFWRASGRSCAPTSNQKTLCSSLGHIRSNLPRRCWSQTKTRRCA